MPLEPDKLHVAIVSWEGMHAKAAEIAEALTETVGRISVVYSNISGTPETGPGNWFGVPQTEFFGTKFKALMDCIQIDETMLLIQADAQCDDWAALARRCLAQLGADSTYGGEVGIWSPSIQGTPFPNNLVATGNSAGPDLIEVWQCDAIVLAMVPSVLDRLRALDFGMNDLGWGIDWAALVEARKRGLWVVRDLDCTIQHPSSRGYESARAAEQMWAFLSQLDEDERATYHAIERNIWLRQAEKAGRVHLMASQTAEVLAAAIPDAIDPDALREAFVFVRLERGRLTVQTARTNQLVELEIGTERRYSLKPLDRAPDFRLLTLAPETQAGVEINPDIRGDWGCPGLTTIQLTLARSIKDSTFPLTQILSLPQSDGALRLSLGLAVHRADVDLLVEWWDTEDRDRGERHFVKFDPFFSGSRIHGDFQAVRIDIPDTGADRALKISLCFWSALDDTELPSVVFLTHPILDQISDQSGTLALTSLGPPAAGFLAQEEVEDVGPGEPHNVLGQVLGLNLGTITDPITLCLGQHRFPLLGGQTENVSLRRTPNGLSATSARPRWVTLALNGRLTRAIWIGPESTPLDLSAQFLATPGARIELLDASGTRVLARETPTETQSTG